MFKLIRWIPPMFVRQPQARFRLIIETAEGKITPGSGGYFDRKTIVNMDDFDIEYLLLTIGNHNEVISLGENKAVILRLEAIEK